MKKVNFKSWNTYTIIFSTLFFITILIQNFIFSENFDILTFRTIDDVAFQSSLRSYHSQLRLLGMNDYAYGWIYWFIITIITYPFYLLHIIFGIDWPLITTPRNISLLATMGSIFTLYKIISIYTKNDFLKFTGVIFFTLSPAVDYYAGRFGTPSLVMFFAILSFYFIAKNDKLNPKNLRYSLLSLAVAGGIKLTGLLISPLIGLMILDRSGWKFSKENWKLWLKEGGVFLLAFIICLCPALLTFRYSRFKNLKNILGSQLSDHSTNYVGESIYNNFYGFINSNSHIAILGVLFLGLLLKTILDIKYQRNRKFDALFILLNFILVLGYLCKSIKHGSTYVSSYASIVYFSLIMGFLFLGYIKKAIFYKLGQMFILVILVSQTIWYYKGIKAEGALDGFSFYKLALSEKPKIEMVNSIRAKIFSFGQPQDGKFHILSDWNFPIIASPLQHDNVCISINWDDFSSTHTACNKPMDFIVFSKTSSAFIPQHQFDEQLNQFHQPMKDKRINDRRNKQAFIKNSIFNGIQYQLIQETNEYWLFKKSSF